MAGMAGLGVATGREGLGPLFTETSGTLGREGGEACERVGLVRVAWLIGLFGKALLIGLLAKPLARMVWLIGLLRVVWVIGLFGKALGAGLAGTPVSPKPLLNGACINTPFIEPAALTWLLTTPLAEPATT